jgi:hypothetical protein
MVFGVGVFGQESDDPKPVGVAELYLAKDDGSGKAGEAAEGFVTSDVPIYCVVQLNSAESTTVRMNLVAVSVPGVKAETKVVSTSYTTKDLQDRVNFSGRPHGQWVAGKYRVDIYIENKLVGSRDFTVQKSSIAKPSPDRTIRPKFDPKPKVASRISKP